MKGQSGVEYLTTYGWAIFVLLIIIAVIVSSGVLTPNYLISEECAFGNNLKCNLALVNTGGQSKLTLELFNGFPYKISVKSIDIQTEDGTQRFIFPITAPINVSSGAIQTYNGSLSGPPVPEGATKRFRGNITYYSCAPELGPACSNVTHSITGRIIAKVIPQ
ncbi:Uncharacterised protein [Candidatus Bilamarchaeum dharawalense]|uniref:Uncharacterized protein n=1 Tax=Candidatus Bilamarchaeum dharawalense TaxID=2885759 RepID=A0A5E4LPP9_9ARCH|nr:Uncharacterised protein [Candidatus Bilamarchaeum dharawalense]